MCPSPLAPPDSPLACAGTAVLTALARGQPCVYAFQHTIHLPSSTVCHQDDFDVVDGNGDVILDFDETVWLNTKNVSTGAFSLNIFFTEFLKASTLVRWGM